MKNLFIVGAQRSGSTYLYKVLDDHPQVSMVHPVRPEPKYFINEDLFHRGKEFYETTYFSDRKPGTVFLGEKSTSYIESAIVAKRIYDYYPDARILMILRDPVARAYSNYRFSVAHQLENLTFREALAAEPDRHTNAKFSTSVSPYSYRKRGHYIEYIEAYLTVFDKSQLCPLIFEEFVGQSASVQALYRWLGINPTFVSGSLQHVFNAATVEEEVQDEAFRDLISGYEDSLDRLEKFLGRTVEVWRKRHHEISSDIAK